MVYIDEVEVDQEGIAEIMLDESAIAQVAREYLRKKLPSFLFINDINSTMPTFLGCSMIELIKLLFIVFYIAGLFFFLQDLEHRWGSLEQVMVEDLLQLSGS